MGRNCRSRCRSGERDRAEIERRAARLTARETQVFELVVAGKPNKVVASDLDLSQKTVEVHRAHVMEKMRAERDGALAEARSYKAQLDTEREALQRLERSLGLSAARVVPVIDNASPEASDPVAEYIAAVEAGDRKTASALFEKHKAAIWQHRNKISKA